MATILDEIVEHRQSDLEELKTRLPLSQLQSKVTKSERDFSAALRDPIPAFILECKKASPSKGLIRPVFDLDEITQAYAHSASAISVLTESRYFQGSFEYLSEVRNRVTQPVLCKDFVIDPYQVFLARHYGADAVLLILAILDDDRYQELKMIAESLGMDTITEVSNKVEQQRALAIKSPIVGINNRNLRDMSIDLDTTRQLAGQLRASATVISESGINDHQQVRELSQHCDGFLIGSSLMAQDNLSAAVNQVIFGDNKVCGLTRRADVLAAHSAGAVFGGMIFADSSPRRVDLNQARALFENTNLLPVGVFQDQSPEIVAQAAAELSLVAVQLHGEEDFRYVRRLRQQLPEDCQIWKALTVDQVAKDAESWFGVSVDRIVVDNRTNTAAGGTGTRFDWSQLPANNRGRMMIAGGLNAENTREAARLACQGLDFNSGVEDQPGIKNPEKIAAVFRQLRTF